MMCFGNGERRLWKRVMCVFPPLVTMCIFVNVYIYRLELKTNNIQMKTVKYKVAVLVPFRDCHEELQQFAPHIFKYLNDRAIPHRIYVINQLDNFRFNRAALINIGFLNMDSDCDYIVMHDIDHLEVNPNFDFGYPGKGPVHLSYSKYKGHVGGVLVMTNEHFRMLNGMSNDFWGWGKEDDDLYQRMLKVGLQVSQPVASNWSNFRYIHNVEKRSRDKATYFNQNRFRSIFNMRSGLNSTKYTLQSRNTSVVNGTTVHFINVILHCDLQKTRFCLKGK
ncbi:beta-1,4-galactosyltransferase 7-like [Mizuhopecten yessoensis]|nr:beta-1,4-galactosyltransferase 7-like [Mizuhopecten yessoensis]